jgi:hypothetical protein
MKLPGGGRAFADIAKLRDYSLNPHHPEGKHKARVFHAALGIRIEDAGWLREKLLKAARELPCEIGPRSVYGQRYTIDCTVSRNERTARLRSAWIVRGNEDFPRLVSCYVL